MSASSEFLDQTIEQFGAERAELVVGTVLESVKFAEEYHQLEWPLRHISIGFNSWPEEVEGVALSPVIGLSDGYFGFRVMPNQDRFDEVIGLVKPVTIHEVTHVAQDQNTYINGEVVDGQTDDPRAFLTYVFNEGVAHWHEQAFLGNWATNPAVNPRFQPGKFDVLAELADIIPIGTDFQRKTLIDYYLGDETVPKKGYRVGCAIVDYVMEKGLVDEHDLVRLTGVETRELCEAYRTAVATGDYSEPTWVVA